VPKPAGKSPLARSSRRLVDIINIGSRKELCVVDLSGLEYGLEQGNEHSGCVCINNSVCRFLQFVTLGNDLFQLLLLRRSRTVVASQPTLQIRGLFAQLQLKLFSLLRGTRR
jgi:hypothetical protein